MLLGGRKGGESGGSLCALGTVRDHRHADMILGQCSNGQMYKPDSVSEIKLDLGTSLRSILGCWLKSIEKQQSTKLD